MWSKRSCIFHSPLQRIHGILWEDVLRIACYGLKVFRVKITSNANWNNCHAFLGKSFHRIRERKCFVVLCLSATNKDNKYLKETRKESQTSYKQAKNMYSRY